MFKKSQSQLEKKLKKREKKKVPAEGHTKVESKTGRTVAVFSAPKL